MKVSFFSLETSPKNQFCITCLESQVCKYVLPSAGHTLALSILLDGAVLGQRLIKVIGLSPNS